MEEGNSFLTDQISFFFFTNWTERHWVLLHRSQTQTMKNHSFYGLCLLLYVKTKPKSERMNPNVFHHFQSLIEPGLMKLMCRFYIASKKQRNFLSWNLLNFHRMQKHMKPGIVENMCCIWYSFSGINSFSSSSRDYFWWETKLPDKLAVIFRMVCRHCKTTHQPDKVQTFFPL